MCVEYAKAKVRVTRWKEELLLVTEEMRHTLSFLDWKARWWEDRTSLRTCRPDIARGVMVYAVRQQFQIMALKERFSGMWHPALAECGMDGDAVEQAG